MKVIISGPAAAFDANERQISDAGTLKSVDGLEYSDTVCAEYLDEPLSEIGIVGGSLRLAFEPSSQTLRVYTEYRAPRKLKKKELRLLLEHTMGQWSDGIGEGCFCDFEDESGIGISVFPIPYDDTAIEVSQIDDGIKTPKPSRLFSAAKSNDVKKLQKLLDKGEPIDAGRPENGTPLLSAVANEQVEAALFLIAHNADVNFKTKDCLNCMKLASMNGTIPVLSALINAGAKPDEPDERGMTPLMWAANRCHEEAMQLLIDNGADINARDSRGHTALMYTAPDRLDILEFLIKRGADPSIRSSDGLTASGEALRQAELERKASWPRPDRAELQERKAELLKQYET